MQDTIYPHAANTLKIRSLKPHRKLGGKPARVYTEPCSINLMIIEFYLINS